MEILANNGTPPADAATPAADLNAAATTQAMPKAPTSGGSVLSTLTLLMIVLSLVLAVVRYKTAVSHNDLGQQLERLNGRHANPPGLGALQSRSAGFVLLLQKVSSGSLTPADCAAAPEDYARFVEARDVVAAELDSRAVQLDPNAYLTMNGQLVQIAMAAAQAVDEVKHACQSFGLPVGGPLGTPAK